MNWRRERYSNPRNRFRFSSFQDHRHRPLGHPSAPWQAYNTTLARGFPPHIRGPRVTIEPEQDGTAGGSGTERRYRLRLSRWLNPEIAEGRGHAVHPQADVPVSMTQPIDHQTGLRAAVDRDADFLLRHVDADVKPPCGIRNRLYGSFVDAWLVLAQLLPRVLRPRDVLHRMSARFGGLVCESKRTEEQGFESRGVSDAERGAEETRFPLTAAAQIDFQRAFRELDVPRERQPDVAADRRIAVRFQTHHRPFDDDIRVDHSPVFRVVHSPDIGSEALREEGSETEERGAADHMCVG